MERPSDAIDIHQTATELHSSLKNVLVQVGLSIRTKQWLHASLNTQPPASWSDDQLAMMQSIASRGLVDVIPNLHMLERECTLYHIRLQQLRFALSQAKEALQKELPIARQRETDEASNAQQAASAVPAAQLEVHDDKPAPKEEASHFSIDLTEESPEGGQKVSLPPDTKPPSDPAALLASLTGAQTDSVSDTQVTSSQPLDLQGFDFSSLGLSNIGSDNTFGSNMLPFDTEQLEGMDMNFLNNLGNADTNDASNTNLDFSALFGTTNSGNPS